MDSAIHSGTSSKKFVFPLLVFLLTAAALFTIHSINANVVSAQPNACSQISDPRDIPSPKILTFDDPNLKDGTLLGTQFQAAYGVVFPNQNPAPVIHTVSNTEADTPASKPNVVQNVSVVGAPRGPLVVGFSFPRTYVGMYLGNGAPPAAGSVTALLTFMDAAGGTLCSFRVNVVPAHTTFAGAYDSLGSISSVSIVYEQSTNLESIDNLYVAPGLNAGARKPQPKWTPLPTVVPTNGPTPTATPVLPLFPVLAYKPPLNIVPVLIKPNFSIFNIEITQGIQCFNGAPSGCSDNSLSQVLSKSSVARVYIRANDSHSIYTNVPVRLHILAFGKEYTMDGAGNATTSMNQGTHDAAEFYFTAYSGAAATVEFWAEVDPNHLYNTSYSSPRYPITGTIVMNFNNRRTFTVAGERLYYHPPTYSGVQYAAGWAVNGGAAQWWNQVLPLSDNSINYFVRSGYLDWTTNLGTGDAQHALIGTLNWMWIQENAFAWLFGAGPFTGVRHVYGWAPAQGYSGGHADMPVYPHAGGLGVVGIGSDAPGTSTDNPGSGALIFGHELTHDYNVKHTNTPDSCGSNDSSSTFPYGSSSIQSYGFNTITGKIYAPNLTHDLMSYCPSGGSKLGWIAPYTWQTMFANLSPLAPLTAPLKGPTLGNTVPAGTLVQTTFTQSLVVKVTINNPGGGSIQAGHFDSLQRITSGLAYTVPSGPFAIEEYDGSNALLSTTPFVVNFASEYPTAPGLPAPPFPAGDTPSEDMSFIVPFADGTRTIKLVYNGQSQQVLDTRTVGSNPPQVTITSPVTPVAWPAKSNQILSWTGISLDNLPLTYSIYYSNDGGVGWTILAGDLATPSYNIIVDSMAGGADIRFRVVASDGVNTGFDETPASITIPNHPPQPIISDPVSSSFHAPGDLIVFHGIATDMEDGTLPDSALNWSDNLQGGLGMGPTVPINNLTPGKHTITLTATDSYGATSSTTVTLTVGYPVFLPRLTK